MLLDMPHQTMLFESIGGFTLSRATSYKERIEENEDKVED
jgi:hypothetical protein